MFESDITPTLSLTKRETQGSITSGVALVLITLMVATLAICLGAFLAGLRNPLLPQQALAASAALSPLYGTVLYIFARRRQKPRTARGVVIITPALFLLGAVGTFLLRALLAAVGMGVR